jgi:hypothetical protein
MFTKTKRVRWVRHVARMGEMKNTYAISVTKPEGKNPLENVRLCVRIISALILKQYDQSLWSGFIWLGIESSGNIL